MSCGAPNSASTRRPRRARRPHVGVVQGGRAAVVRHGLGAAAGQGAHDGPAAPALPGRRSRRPGRRRRARDRPTPETTDSPRPGAASITACPRRPVTGFAVNRTPAHRASTMRLDDDRDRDRRRGRCRGRRGRRRPGRSRATPSIAGPRRAPRPSPTTLQERVLLTGEARVRQVLGGRRRADRDRPVGTGARTASSTSSGIGPRAPRRGPAPARLARVRTRTDQCSSGSIADRRAVGGGGHADSVGHGEPGPDRAARLAALPPTRPRVARRGRSRSTTSGADERGVGHGGLVSVLAVPSGGVAEQGHRPRHRARSRGRGGPRG